jgi:hypothetical protein
MRASSLRPALLRALYVAAMAVPVAAWAQEGPRAVNVDNFKRVETDLYFAKFVRDGSLGQFQHAREPVPIDQQDVIRMNRDTLYSSAVVDLDAGPVTVALPDTGGRFMGMQVIDEDHYTVAVEYRPGRHTFTRERVGTRYALFLVRTFVDPADPADLKRVHTLQDAIAVTQARPGEFEIPDWDTSQATKLREALNALAAANGGLDSARMFGSKEQVDPVQHLLGTAAGWGGNPAADALYAGVVPPANDGRTAYRLTVGDVPVDGFWSISVYNKDGFFEHNARGAYSLNNVTARRDADGSVTVQFGGCDGYDGNCIPITPGWSYLIRMYRPRKEILDGTWKFPTATPVG